MERDFHLNAEEALEFGIVDRIQRPKPKEVEGEEGEKKTDGEAAKDGEAEKPST